MVLRIEHIRKFKKVTLTDIGDCIETTWATARNKIQGKTAFTLPEAQKIHKKFFQEYDFDYLFTDDGTGEKPVEED